jgi:hypothetical protein
MKLRATIRSFFSVRKELRFARLLRLLRNHVISRDKTKTSGFYFGKRSEKIEPRGQETKEIRGGKVKI